MTLVPIPTSKTKTDPNYDDRILATLRGISPSPGVRVDLRELIDQSSTRLAAHDGGSRSIEVLTGAWNIDETQVKPVPSWIVLFDDVITTGCHFKAASRVLKDRFPNVRITGVFIARRVPEASSFEELFNDDDL